MAFTSKSDLSGYYMEKLNAVEITLGRMVIFEETAQMLLDKYMRKQVGIMLALERKPVDFTHNISYYAKDSRLTGEPDGKRYKWREMIARFKLLGRPLSDRKTGIMSAKLMKCPRSMCA